MCFDIDRFVDQNLAGMFQCTICQGVLCCPQSNQSQPVSKQEPVNGTEGGHKYCERCINGWLDVGTTCPNCNKRLNKKDLQPLDWFAYNILKGLKIRCKNYKQGCQFIDDLEIIEKHYCPYSHLAKCEKCNSLMPNLQEAHTDRDCNQKLVELVKNQTSEIQNKDTTIKLLKDNIRDLNNEKTQLMGKLQIERNKVEQLNETIKDLNKQLNKSAAASTESVINSQVERKKQSMLVNRRHRGTVVDIPELVQLCESRENQYSKIKDLIENQNANVNIRVNDYTPLMWATWNGHLNISKLLIENGANVNDKVTKFFESGNTCLIYTARQGYTEIAQLLLDNGANVNDVSQAPFHAGSALDIASSNGYIDIVRLLIENNASINEKDNKGSSALKRASNHGHFNVVKLLLENGATVNNNGHLDDTALVNASGSGYLNIVKLLIENGAVVDEKTISGHTALIKASEKGYTEIVKFLVQNGANVNEKTNNGLTTLSIAKNDQIKTFLISKGAF